MHLEEEREHRQKLQNQESWRKQLDTSLRLKLKRLAQEQQENLALDMSILEQLLAQAKDEKKEEALRKVGSQHAPCARKYLLICLLPSSFHCNSSLKQILMYHLCCFTVQS